MKLCIIVMPCILLLGLAGYAQTGNRISRDTTASVKVFGVCEQCKNRIEGALKIKGISKAEWNIDTKMLTVSYDLKKTNLEKINNKVASVGHDTYNKKARDADYFA